MILAARHNDWQQMRGLIERDIDWKNRHKICLLMLGRLPCYTASPSLDTIITRSLRMLRL